MPRLQCISPGFGQLATFADGSRRVCFNESELGKAVSASLIELPCRKCLPCAHNRGLDWGTRAFCEAREAGRSAMLSLTYREAPPTFQYRDVNLFVKRLRQFCARSGLGNFRYAIAGEHGGVAGRTHYHMLIFGQDFREISLYQDPGVPFYKCPDIERLWGHGNVDIRPVLVERCMYVAMHGVKAFHSDHKEPPLWLYSKVPPLGFSYFQKFIADCASKGYFTDGDGNKLAIPSHVKKWPAFSSALLMVKEEHRAFIEGLTPDERYRMNRHNSAQLRQLEERLRLKAIEVGRRRR